MDFYWLNILLSFFGVCLYGSFRIGVHSYLRYKKKSKTFIKKSTKGFLNYWLYRNLKQELGFAYYMNQILLFGSLGYTLLSVSFAWSDVLHLPIAIIYAIFCIIQCVGETFAGIYHNLEQYGNPFVISSKSKWNGRKHSSVQDILIICCLIALAVFNIWLAVE